MTDHVQQFEERKCLTCQGSGRSERDPLRKCDFCDGVGFVQRPKQQLGERCGSLHPESKYLRCALQAGHETFHQNGPRLAWADDGTHADLGAQHGFPERCECVEAFDADGAPDGYEYVCTLHDGRKPIRQERFPVTDQGDPV